MARNEDDRDIEADTTRPASLPFDPARYRAEVDGFDITDEQKDELLTTLWSIMRSFVELGFTVDLCTVLSNDPISIPDSNKLS